MTCFWDHILKSLNQEDLQMIGLNYPTTNTLFIDSLQKNNKLCENVIWQNNSFKKRLLEENLLMVKEFNSQNINKGYDCSTCDPFLILLSELLRVDIDHLYQDNLIQYRVKDSRKLLKFKSTSSHFYI